METTKDTFEEFKKVVVKDLRSSKEPDKVFMVSSKESWSKNQMADEIEKGSERGLWLLNGLMRLTIDLVERQKKQIPE